MVKISRPRPKEAYPRIRLFDRLDGAESASAIWVSAPAGAGKTTLVSSYIEEKSVPCLWYRIDRGDADLPTFFYYMGVAAKKAVSGKRVSLPYLTPEYSHGVSAFSSRYFEQLYARLKTPCVLVFDNYQEAPVESGIHDIISSAISSLPEGIRIFIISRNDPPAQFRRLQANRSIYPLKWNEMKLTVDEARGIVGLRKSGAGSDRAFRRIFELSGGWAAGLVLICQAAGSRGVDFQPEESAGFEEVFDYFASEVFARLDHAMQDFFLTTSFLPKMTSAMAEELTGNPAASTILKEMERRNYFIARISGQAAMYEYHPLYRDFLLARAKSALASDRLLDVQRKAACILENSGQTEEAVVLLAEIRDWKRISEIVLVHAPDMIRQGRHIVVRKWIADIPDIIKDGNSLLLYWRGMSLLSLAPSQSLPLFERARKLFDLEKDEIGIMLASAGAVYAIVWDNNNFARLDRWYLDLHEHASSAGDFPNREIEAYVITAIIMCIRFRDISHPAAEMWLEKSISLEETPETLNAKVHAHTYLVWKELLALESGRAGVMLEALKKLALTRYAQPVTRIIVKVTEALYNAMISCNDQTIRACCEGLDIARKTGVHFLNSWFYISAAVSCINCMDIRGARQWFGEMEGLAKELPNWAGTLYYGQLARLSLLEKDLQRALHYGQLACDVSEKAGSEYALTASRLMLAVVLHKRGARTEALKYLELCRAYSLRTQCRCFMVLAELYEAGILFDDGNDARAGDLLLSSLTHSREKGGVFAFVDDPATTAQMLSKAIELGIEVDYACEIIRRRRLIPESPPVHVENWPWAIRIHTFGRFSLQLGDRPVRFSGKVQQMPLKLLKALISLGGREAPVNVISGTLWPDADGDMAQQSLETTLHRLRKLLACQDAITYADRKLTLDNRYCWVDIWTFERLLGQADDFKKKKQNEQAAALTEKALKFYRGPFMSSEEEEPWVVSAAERLGGKFLSGAIWLGNQYESAQAWDQAISHYERCLEIDDRIEDFYSGLMNCYVGIGKKGAAQAVYRRCKKILFSSLGIEPSEEITCLYTSLISNG